MSQMQKMFAALEGPMKKLRGPWDEGIMSQLPEAYKKFWREWREKESTPVHWQYEEGTWKRNPETGEVQRVNNVPLLPLHTPEQNLGIWGGEVVIQGFQKRKATRRRVPHFWMPALKRSVVYSEILDKYMSVVLTDRTLQLIDEHVGFDYYILKTPACDLKSLLAFKLKRKMYLALLRRELYQEDPQKQEEVYNKYKEFLIPEEEAEWYGLSLTEACVKMSRILEEQKPVPLKHKFRQELIQELRERDAEKAEAVGTETKESISKWMPKFNIFGGKST